MVVEAELLRDDVDNQRLFTWRELINALCPKRNSKAEEEHRFDQYDGEFQMRRDTAPHAGVISTRLTPFPETNQDENKKRRPSNKERAHEPVTKLEDMVDLISMRRSVRRLAQEFIDQRGVSHICSHLPPWTP